MGKPVVGNEWSALDDFIDNFDPIQSECVVKFDFQLPLSLLVLKKGRGNDKD